MSSPLRQVRATHPPELMQLAVLLSRGRQKREVAAVLGVPLSTIYRWLESRRRHPFFDGVHAAANGEDSLCALISACEQRGVRVRNRARLLALAGISEERLDSSASANGAATCANPGMLPAPDSRAQGNVIAFERPPAGALGEEVRRRLQQVRDRIDHAYFTHLSCADFSRIAAMSKYNLINRFRRVYGVSPYHYLLQVRIQQAKKLLGSTPASLGAIASAVGFDSPSSLSKSFRNIEGVSLSQFCRGLAAPAAPAHEVQRGMDKQSAHQSI
jgi:AraC-like DNA-binding protein